MTQTTADRVRRVLAEYLGTENPPDTANIFADLGADSLDQVEIVMALEEEFGIEMTDDQMTSIGTVGDLIAMVDGLVQG